MVRTLPSTACSGELVVLIHGHGAVLPMILALGMNWRELVGDQSGIGGHRIQRSRLRQG